VRLPAPWLVLMDYLRVPPGLGEAWWTALCRSRWSRPASLRQAVLLFEAVPHKAVEQAVAGFFHTTCAPAQLIATLEDMVQEQLLPRLKASRLEEYIFARCGPTGAWK
jgi:hypothetical protein